jgi:CYTH domain-containing protein
MPVEIERKALVADEGWRSAVIDSEKLRDGLVGEFDGCKVRVRLSENRASITVKGPRSGPRRTEFEYEIPKTDAEAMLDTVCGERRVEKTRHWVPYAGFTWAVDVYEGNLAGIVVAEIELAGEEQAFEKPDWVGTEITNNPRFSKRELFRLCTDAGRPLTVAELLAGAQEKFRMP